MGSHIWAKSVGVLVAVLSISGPAAFAQTVADTAPVIFLGHLADNGTGGGATRRTDCKAHVADTLSKLGYVVDQGGDATELHAHHPALPVGIAVRCGYFGRLAITTLAGSAQRWRPEHLRVQNALHSVFNRTSPSPLRQATTEPAVTGPSAPPPAVGLVVRRIDVRPSPGFCSHAARSVLTASGYAIASEQGNDSRVRGTKGGEAILFLCAHPDELIGAVHAGGAGRDHSRAEADRLLTELAAAHVELTRIKDAEARAAAEADNQRACARAAGDPPVPRNSAHLFRLPLRVTFPFTPCRVETATADGQLITLTLDHDRASYVASILEPVADGVDGRILLDQALERLRATLEFPPESENIYEHQGNPAVMVWGRRSHAGQPQTGVVRLVAYQGRIYTQAFWYDPSVDVEVRLKQFSDSFELGRTPPPVRPGDLAAL